MDDLDLEVRTVAEKRAVLAVKGRLNAITAPALKTQIRELVSSGHVELVCDLAGVGFLDSSGLSALVSGLKASREANGWLKLAGLNEQVGRIFRLTMLDHIFEIFPDVEAALA
jgi:anti-sigma B factor antagonist